MIRLFFSRFPLFCLFACVAQNLLAQANLPVFTNNLVNGFQDWSYNCTRNFTNNSPVHQDNYSIAVVNSSGGSLVLHLPAGFSTVPYANVSFWINGGATGGQLLRVYGQLNGSQQAAYNLPALAANTWQQYTILLAALGVANSTNFNAISIQNATSGAQPVYYVDDIQIGVASAPSVVHLNVDASQAIRQADSRWFGMNTWINHDGDATIDLSNPETATLLQQAGVQATRWPGGSKADYYYNWAANESDNEQFYQTATNLGINSQAFITVNYGSGTPVEAAGWVADANVTNNCNFKYWEIGNECYGTWELDNNTNNGDVAHDPYTYAVRAAQYMQLMRAVDPTIKIGIVATPGDNNNINNYNHSAYNARTGQTAYGWTPVMLATLKSLGANPDFLIYHYYAQDSNKPWVAPSPSADSDPLLLQQSHWAADAATFRQEISDYYGTGGTNIELCITELNSDVSNGGRQMSSLVNALYMADTISQIMQTEFNSAVWFGLRDYQGTGGDMDPTLYGWRNYGDYAIIYGLNGLYPTYYSMQLLHYFVRPGDTILNAGSDYPLLAAYASRRSDGALNVLMINKDATTNFNGQINLTNFTPATNATIHSYGIPQDNAAKNDLSATLQNIAVTNYSGAGSQFNYLFPPYSLTLFTFLPTNYITLSLMMGAGMDWNTANYWSDGNPASVSGAASPAAVYDALAGSLLRSPLTGGATFPGNQLIINGDGNWVSGGSATISEFRLVSSPVTVPWLRMNNGQLDLSGTTNAQFVLNGRLDILANTPIYNDPANDEGLAVNAFLAGTGNVEWRDAGFALANGSTLNITGNTNTFSGTWNVIQGTLLGSGTDALGTNSITVGASGYLETTYDLNNPNATLNLKGKLLLHQNDTFKSVTVGGRQLSAGAYTFAQLNAAYPASFPATWLLQNGSSVVTGSGSLTVLSVNPPVIISQPQAATALYAGSSVQFSVSAAGGQPLAYQWQAGTMGSGPYTNQVNSGNVSGVTNMVLTLTNITTANAAAFIVVVTNAGGAVTSSVANLTIVSPDGSAYQAAMLGSSPVAFYELNETANPASGSVAAYDYVGGYNGVYGSAVQNGYNNIAGPRFVPDGLAGFLNSNLAANFTNNTANSQINLPALNLDTNTVTITAWVKPQSQQNGDAGIVFSRSGTTVAGLCYTGTQIGNNYTLGYNWNNDQNVWSWNSGLVAAPNQWSLLALSVGSTSATIYILNTNGVTSATHTYSHVVQNFDGVTLIGDDSADGGNGARGFNGVIDDVAIFNRTLTLSQLNSLFATGNAPTASFTSSRTNGFAPLPVTFADTSLGNITNRHWIFGDGTTLDTTTTSVSHTYSTGGTNLVTLIVSGPNGLSSNTLGLVVSPVPSNGLWTVNFCCVNTVNGALGTPYVGPGIIGSGTYWNPMTGVQSASAATTYRDDGTTSSGSITFAGANLTGNYSGNLPYTIQLLDMYSYFTSVSGATFTFANIPNGVYNLVLYGINGHWDDHQVMFTVNGVSRTLTSVQDNYFAPDNTCIYTNMVVTNNQLVVHMAGQPTIAEPANTEGDFDGAQLQLVSLTTPPTFSRFSRAGNSLMIEDVGTPLATYGLFSWTNLLFPANGMLMATGIFDPVTGLSTNLMPIISTNAAMFFRLKSPYP